MRYASATSVPVERSKAEIERILRNYGAEKFAYFVSDDSAAIGFQVRGRAVRMTVALPSAADFARTERGRPRVASAQQMEREKAMRQRWRALLLIVKAKLEAVETGITTFEREWLPYLVLPNGRTVAEQVEPQLDAMLARGEPPTLLLGMDGAK